MFNKIFKSKIIIVLSLVLLIGSMIILSISIIFSNYIYNNLIIHDMIKLRFSADIFLVVYKYFPNLSNNLSFTPNIF